MALSDQSVQYLNSLPFLREIDASAGPAGPTGVVAYTLVPSNGWLGSQRFPHDVNEELAAEGYDTTSVEGIDYYRVPEVSNNLPGRLSEYAQRTGVAELQNPPSGGVNPVASTFAKDGSASASADPEGVKKYVADNDNVEDARKKDTEHNLRVERQVTTSPAREPAEGKLEVPKTESSSAPSKPVAKAPAKE